MDQQILDKLSKIKGVGVLLAPKFMQAGFINYDDICRIDTYKLSRLTGVSPSAASQIQWHAEQLKANEKNFANVNDVASLADVLVKLSMEVQGLSLYLGQGSVAVAKADSCLPLKAELTSVISMLKGVKNRLLKQISQ